jgi:hypothetical protein
MNQKDQKLYDKFTKIKPNLQKWKVEIEAFLSWTKDADMLDEIEQKEVEQRMAAIAAIEERMYEIELKKGWGEKDKDKELVEDVLENLMDAEEIIDPRVALLPAWMRVRLNDYYNDLNFSLSERDALSREICNVYINHIEFIQKGTPRNPFDHKYLGTKLNQELTKEAFLVTLKEKGINFTEADFLATWDDIYSNSFSPFKDFEKLPNQFQRIVLRVIEEESPDLIVAESYKREVYIAYMSIENFDEEGKLGKEKKREGKIAFKDLLEIKGTQFTKTEFDREWLRIQEERATLYGIGGKKIRKSKTTGWDYEEGKDGADVTDNVIPPQIAINNFNQINLIFPQIPVSGLGGNDLTQWLNDNNFLTPTNFGVVRDALAPIATFLNSDPNNTVTITGTSNYNVMNGASTTPRMTIQIGQGRANVIAGILTTTFSVSRTQITTAGAIGNPGIQITTP